MDLNAQRDRELAALERKKIYARNNLAGASWEQSISGEMQAVNQTFDAKAQLKRDEIRRLQERAAQASR